MERPQGGRTLACQGMRGMSEEQRGDKPPSRTTTAASHSERKVGKHLDGFHYWGARGAGQGLHLCGR